MADKEQYRPYIIEKLNSYGITRGPNGQNLRTWNYYELRGFLGLEEIKRGEEILPSPWF